MPGISKHVSVCVLSLTLASAAFASRVGTLGLVRMTSDAKTNLSTECYVTSEGITYRVIAGEMFDPAKLIVNKKTPAGGAFFGFTDLEKKFEEFRKTKATASKAAASDVEVKYEARSFDAHDNPIAFLLYKKERSGDVQERTEPQARAYRGFLDAVCN